MRQITLFLILIILFPMAMHAQLYKWEKKEVQRTLFNSRKLPKKSFAPWFFNIYEDQEQLMEEGYKEGKRLDQHNYFYTGIFGDVFMAIAVLQLQNAGKLNIEDQINKYFPNFGEDLHAVTIQHLLQHTSGIPDYKLLLQKKLYRYVPIDDQIDLIDTIAQKGFLLYPPGQNQQYSKTNFWLIHKIIEKASDQSLEDYLHERVFRPLDLSNTRIVKAICSPFREKSDQCPNFAYRESDLTQIGLYTTPADIKRFMDQLFTPNKFDPDIRQALLKESTLNNGTKTNMSLGGIQKLTIHNALTYKFSSLSTSPNHEFYYLPDRKISFIALGFYRSNFNPLIRSMMTTIYGNEWLKQLEKAAPEITYIEEVKKFGNDISVKPSGQIQGKYYKISFTLDC